MATISPESPLYGSSGRFGNLIVYQCNGRTYARARTDARQLPATEDQLIQRGQFGHAARYAKEVNLCPTTRALYAPLAAAANLSVYQLAVRDYLRPPVIAHIIDVEYDGRAGDSVRVYASDDTKVASVYVKLRDASGRVIEEGLATDREHYWRYEAKCDVPRESKVTIEAVARDLAHNTNLQTTEVYVGQ